MSGICAVFDLEGPTIDLEGLRTVAKAASNRGPDGIAYWTGGDVGLGHLAQRSTPEAAGETQPALSDDRRLCVVADVRLDHRNALADSLRTAGTLRAAHPGDAQLILAAYERWVEECPAHLDGDFAFALWDGHKQRLFCARDAHGGRPLHFLRLGTALWVGSDPRQLLALPGVSHEIDPIWVAAYLTDLSGDAQRTPFHSLRQLPPGWRMIAGTTEIDVDRVPQVASLQPAAPAADPPSTVDRHLAETEGSPGHVESITEEFREALDSAVLSCLHTSSPIVGLLLGDDLAADLLATTATGLLNQSGRGSKLLALLHQRRELPDGIDSLAEPATAEIAADLAGLLSDETAVPLDSPCAGWEKAATAQLRGLTERGGTVLLTTLGCPSGVANRPPSSAAPAWLAPQLLQTAGIEESLEATPPTQGGPVNNSPWALATTSLRRALEWTERAAVAHGIEVRHPFLDRHLQSTISALADEVEPMADENPTGSSLHRALADLLPDVPVGRPLVRPAASIPAAAIVVARQRLAGEPLVVSLGLCHPARLRRALAGVEEASDAERDALWRTLTLERWLQAHQLSVVQPSPSS